MASKMKALQTWCQKHVKDHNNVNITNMTTSWRDGLAFCALIHHYRPDLIDFDSLSKENILKNNQLAFEVAERELGIAALLDAEDMVAMKVPDKLSIITYVSQYYNVLHKLTPVAGGTSSKPQKRSASPLKLEESSVKRSPKPEEPPKMFVEKVQKFSLCEICKKKVHLVERFIDEGKIYHRHCHRTKSLSGMYRRDGSALMHNYMDNLKSPTKKETTPIPNKVKSNLTTSSGVKAKVTAMEVSETNIEQRNSAKDTKEPPKNETATNRTPFVKPATNKNPANRAMEVTPAKTNISVANKDLVVKPQEKSPVKQFKVTDMVSKFSTTQPSQQQWTPPSKRNSGAPSSTSSNRNSTASSDSKTNLNPFGDEKADKTSTQSSGKSSKINSSSNDTSIVVSTKESSKTIINAPNKAPKSSKGDSGDVVARSLFPSGGSQALTKDESQAKTNIASDSETGSKSNIQAVETSKGPKSTSPAAKTPLLSQSKRPTDLSSDIKELNKEPIKKVDSKLKNDETTAEMLPSLLKSLSDVKNKRKEEKDRFLSPKDDDISPSSKTAPLIAELPKVSDKPVPSARKSPRPNVALDPPKPQPRLSRASTNSTPGNRNDSVDYNDELNPFAEPDSSSSSEPSPEIKESLNPFEMDDDDVDDIDGDKSDSEGNPFGDEEEAYVEPNQKETPKENGHKTLNVVGPGENRLNPFTDEYEDKKSPNLSQKATGTPPRPPSRRKGKAPAPPKPTTDTPPKAPVVSVGKTPEVPVTPPVRNKRPAPNWKNNVEKQMEKLNEDNKTDKKYVEKTDKTASPKHQENIARSNAQVPSPNVTKAPSSKSTRAAPGFGFPLVKRKVKSQMTEEEITSEMAVVDLQLKDLERKGVKLEEVLREDMESGNDSKPESDQLLSEWFDLVHQKNKLVRRETELVFLMQQQRLEQQHADVEFMIRKLLNKPDSEKTEAEKEQEGKLVEELVKIVERRNTIINSIEEERVKEEEEDAAYDMMKKLQRDSPNDSDGTKKKKKNKVKKMFSKKNKKEKTFTTPETKKK